MFSNYTFDHPAGIWKRESAIGTNFPSGIDPVGVSFLKTSSAAEILAFQPVAGYRLQHENNHRNPRCLRPRIRYEPRDGTPGKYRSSPTNCGPEARKDHGRGFVRWTACSGSFFPACGHAGRTPSSSSSPRQSSAGTARGSACSGNGNRATESRVAREPRRKYANSSNE